MKAQLILKDNSVFEGESFGANKNISGEVVFTTGMVGYPQAITDPSFKGQILVMTFPIVGSYGVPPRDFWESDKIQVSALVVSNYIDTPSHHSSEKTLKDWCKEENIPLLEIKDTRVLAKKLREDGSMLGKIDFDFSKNKKKADFINPDLQNLPSQVSTKNIYRKGEGKNTIVVIDCGMKRNILNMLVARGVSVAVVPWNTDVTKLDFPFQGVVISNGPGDPKMVKETINNVKKIIAKKIPILGICLGNQILALANGGNTSKLKFGHRSQNQPVVNNISKKCFLTTQNHGFVLKKIPKGFKEWFYNANDFTNEGIIHNTLPFMSVQFHPESSPGPTDTSFIFDLFLEKAKIRINKK